MATRTSTNDTYASNTAYNVSRNYTVNGLNQYTAAGGATFTYDANGNLIGDGTNAYKYDVENRLYQVTGGVSGYIVYDPLGRIFEYSGGGGITHQFLWDGDALVAEYSVNGGGTMLRRYVHGNGSGDDPLMWYEGATLGQGRSLFANHQGSIVAVSAVSGATVAINAYDPWGIPNSTNQGRFQYTGQIYLPEIGLYHYKGRIYSPTLGRFLQTDPIGYEDQVNLYAYVGNDSVNRADPTGTKCDPVGVQHGGATKWDCHVDLVRDRDANGNPRTRAPTAQEQPGFRRFNRQYTRATNELARNPQRTGTVPPLQGGNGSFSIRAGESAASLTSRTFVHDTLGDKAEPGTLMTSSGVYNPDLGRVEDPTTYVSDQGLSQATMVDIVHDGGMHSTFQEWQGGLQDPSYPLGQIDHQLQYNGVACRLLNLC